ncbi:MAG: archaellin/type IV pilin N-terminal domain-containing protein [Ignisphaera sp.]
MKSRLYKGIEPIIAVVILVAVTLVIAIGVIGWIMGWWGTMGATESVRVYPDSYINASNKVLYLHVKNEGSASAVIYKVEIVGVTTITTFGAATTTETTITPGQETTLTLSFNANVVAGTNYQVKVYTKAGNVISATVQAK